MTRILHIQASPRGAESKSNEIARARIDTLRRSDPSIVVDTLDLWREPLPEFEGNSAAAKMSFFGVGQLDGAKRAAWDRIVVITERFKAADHYVLGVPMWNGGIPYRLKLYIDIITQPGLLFGFDPAKGYFGLLKDKKRPSSIPAACSHQAIHRNTVSISSRTISICGSASSASRTFRSFAFSLRC